MKRENKIKSTVNDLDSDPQSVWSPGGRSLFSEGFSEAAAGVSAVL